MNVKNWIIGHEGIDNQSNVLWNIIGSSVYALSSMILTYLTIRIVGVDEGGLFAIGLTLAQMFVYFAYYEMRNYQVTDAKDKYTFNEYHTTKIICCVMMMVISCLYAICKNYDGYKSAIVILVCFYRMLDGYADLYEAQFHNKGRLDLAGKSMTFRTILTVVVYFGILIATNNLMYSLVAANVFGIIGILIFNIWIIPDYGTLRLSYNGKHILGIIKDCFPLFIGMFLWTYLLSASRMAVDNVLTSADQSYYQVLFMPVSVINLFAGFLIRPSLLTLTEHYANGNKEAFWKIIFKILFVLTCISIACMILAYLIGIPVLQLIAGCDLSNYRTLFVFLICAGGFNSIAYSLYFVLTIFRNRFAIIFGYGVATIVAFLLSDYLTRIYGLWGAAFSYFVSIIVLLFVFVMWLVFVANKDNK